MRAITRLMFILATVAAVACRQGERSNESRTDSTVAVQTPPAAKPCLDGAAILEHDGVGALRIGKTVDSVRAACQVVRDTVGTNEGQPERRIAVAIGVDTVTAVVVGDSIWRIHVRTPGIRTADSVGVGTTAARLRGEPGARVISGEGKNFIVVPSRCGFSFRIGGTTIDEVLVLGCQRSVSAR